MKYLDLLWKNHRYMELLEKLEEVEQTRIYCRHDMAHFTDVARLSYIKVMENHLDIEKEMIYLTAFLHDIGRVQEYEKGISHAKASALLAGEILVDIGYEPRKIEQISYAIEGHQKKDRIQIETTVDEEKNMQELADILIWADQHARACFICKSVDSCKWSETRKNTADGWI